MNITKISVKLPYSAYSLSVFIVQKIKLHILCYIKKLHVTLKKKFLADSQLHSNFFDLFQNCTPGLYENCFFTVWDIAPLQIAERLCFFSLRLKLRRLAQAFACCRVSCSMSKQSKSNCHQEPRTIIWHKDWTRFIIFFYNWFSSSMILRHVYFLSVEV